MYRIRFYVLVTLLSVCSFSELGSWSYLYKIDGSRLEKKLKKTRETYRWLKRAIDPFTELIFSWNALRPAKGYYSFWVKVRDKATKKWYPWHKMSIWGLDARGKYLQKSFSSKKNGATFYNYVRLELPQKKFADAFKVKVGIHNSSLDKTKIEQLIVNTANRSKFKSEVGTSLFDALNSVTIAKIPKYSQMILNHPKFDSLCSPTSISMVLGYLLKREINPIEIAENVFDGGLDIYGSWPFNVAYGYELGQGKIAFHVEKLQSFKVLYNLLKNSLPVIVSVRGPLEGGATPYANGHLLVVIGYNKEEKKVICHDPAFSDNESVLVSYDLDKFVKAWERSYRLAYIAEPKVLF